jgi:uncharacterized membrane protein YeaQ/YmgE (transglycosylase-associated protein family)
MSGLVGCICIGLAAGLAACLWPFRRGLLGIGLNIGAGGIGAAGMAALGRNLGLSARDPAILLLGSIGAFALIAVMHAVWAWRHTRLPSRRQMLSRP